MNEKRYLFPGEGRFYKANLHCHTVVSDGRLTPEEIKKAFAGHGYDIVAFSDHNTLVDHQDLTDGGFLALNALEIDFNQPPREAPPGCDIKVFHLNFFAKDPGNTDFPAFERAYKREAVQKLIDDANRAGFLVQYNHPRWSMQGSDEFALLKGLFGFEVYNHGCQQDMNNGWGNYEYEYYLREGGDAAPVATDDNHCGGEDIDSLYSDCFGGFTMIKADRLDYAAVIDALENKNCYASTGPLILDGSYERLENGGVRVCGATSPCRAVFVRTNTRHTGRLISRENDVEAFDVTLAGGTRWFRIEVVDDRGNMAVSKAYSVEDLV